LFVLGNIKIQYR